MSHKLTCALRGCETVSTVHHPYPRRLVNLMISRCNYKGTTFSLVSLKTPSVGLARVCQPTTLTTYQFHAQPTEPTRRQLFHCAYKSKCTSGGERGELIYETDQDARRLAQGCNIWILVSLRVFQAKRQYLKMPWVKTKNTTPHTQNAISYPSGMFGL